MTLDGKPTAAARFSQFLATSGTSAAVNFLLRYLMSRVMPFELAVSCAYVCSTALAFLLAKRFVFGHVGGRWRSQFGRFIVVNVFGFVQVLTISAVLVHLLLPAIGITWHAEEMAHFIGLASLALTSYHAHALFSFRMSNMERPIAQDAVGIGN